MLSFHSNDLSSVFLKFVKTFTNQMNLLTKVLICCIFQSIYLSSIESNSLNGNQIECKADIVETIPNGLTFNSSVISDSTFDGLISLISRANHSVEIASFYWTLLGTDVMPKPDESSLKGKQVLNAIIDSSKSRGVKIRIAVNQDQNSDNSTDLEMLTNFADIRRLNFTRLIGAGILHTKFIVGQRNGCHFVRMPTSRSGFV